LGEGELARPSTVDTNDEDVDFGVVVAVVRCIGNGGYAGCWFILLKI